MKKKNLLFLSLVGFGMLLSACGNGGESSVPASSASQEQSQSQGQSQSQSAASSSGEEEEENIPDVVYTENLRIYYHRDDMNYKGWAIYLWNSSVDGKEYAFTGVDEEYGVYFDINLSTSEQFKDYPSTDIRVIIKKEGSWDGQSLDTFCYFKKFIVEERDGQKYMNIYLAKGEGKKIEVYSRRDDALGDHFDACYVDPDWKSIRISGAGTQGSRKAEEVGLIKSYELYAFTTEYYSWKPLKRAENESRFLVEKKELDKPVSSLSITLPDFINPTTQYEIRGYFADNPTKMKAKAISVDKIFDTERFKNEYTYKGNDLGITFNDDDSRTYKVWAPTSALVKVRYYIDGTPWNLRGSPVVDLYNDYPMTYEGKGVWSYTTKTDLSWYTYVAINANGEIEAVDPYAKAVGTNGERGSNLDFSSSSASPAGWNEGKAVDDALPKINSANNLTVYEAHIRDLTADETWSSNEGNLRGTYNAFCEEGTTYTANGVTVKTGFDHIKELGVNAIQLLPVFDQDNDERQAKVYKSTEDGGVLDPASYNWGYNPQNYNAVEGAYSSKPSSAATRVSEFKNLVMKCARNGMRVIMDVVYNHMSSVANNSFTKLVPGYFFRTDANGEYTDGSGCGNEVATERPMASKFIVDSVKWWASEYRIKGFRFDLMGCIDLDTMKAVRAAVNEIDPSIVLYGEGWTGGGSALDGGKQSSTNNVYLNLNTNDAFPVGCFNDAGRDGAKGNTKWADVVPASGWINEGSNVDNVYNTLTQIIGENRWAKQACGGDSFRMNPNQTVNYLACHDNYTLYDQINYLYYAGSKGFGEAYHTDVMDACTGLTALSLMGQGIGFINGGDELFRQKLIRSDDYWYEELKASYKHATNGVDSWIEGDGVAVDPSKADSPWLVRNSYKYGDAVNSFKWDRKANEEVLKRCQAIADVIHLREHEMGNSLGQNIAQIENEGATCWSYNDLFNTDGSSKTDLIAGHFKGQQDGKPVYIFTNKGNGQASIGIGNGTMEVLYSSLGDRSSFVVGGQKVITNNTITLDKYETLVVRQVA